MLAQRLQRSRLNQVSRRQHRSQHRLEEVGLCAVIGRSLRCDRGDSCCAMLTAAASRKRARRGSDGAVEFPDDVPGQRIESPWREPSTASAQTVVGCNEHMHESDADLEIPWDHAFDSAVALAIRRRDNEIGVFKRRRDAIDAALGALRDDAEDPEIEAPLDTTQSVTQLSTERSALEAAHGSRMTELDTAIEERELQASNIRAERAALEHRFAACRQRVLSRLILLSSQLGRGDQSVDAALLVLREPVAVRMLSESSAHVHQLLSFAASVDASAGAGTALNLFLEHKAVRDARAKSTSDDRAAHRARAQLWQQRDHDLRVPLVVRAARSYGVESSPPVLFRDVPTKPALCTCGFCWSTLHVQVRRVLTDDEVKREDALLRAEQFASTAVAPSASAHDPPSRPHPF